MHVFAHSCYVGLEVGYVVERSRNNMENSSSRCYCLVLLAVLLCSPTCNAVHSMACCTCTESPTCCCDSCRPEEGRRRLRCLPLAAQQALWVQQPPNLRHTLLLPAAHLLGDLKAKLQALLKEARMPAFAKAQPMSLPPCECRAAGHILPSRDLSSLARPAAV